MSKTYFYKIKKGMGGFMGVHTDMGGTDGCSRMITVEGKSEKHAVTMLNKKLKKMGVACG